MSKSKPMHLFYSLEYDSKFGHCLYKNSEGELVKATCTGFNKEWIEQNYLWKDREYLGEGVFHSIVGKRRLF